MAKLREHLEYIIEQDLFMARVRGTTSELVINNGYEGILTIDCKTQKEPTVISYPMDEFSIYSWVMSPRGDVSYAYSENEAEGALCIDRQRGTAAPLAIPAGIAPLTDLAWFGVHTLLLDYEGKVWRVDGSQLVPASQQEIDACLDYFYRRVLSHYAIVKTDPYERGVYVRSKEFERKTIGFMPFNASETPMLMEQDGTAVDTARFGKLLFVSYESQIVIVENNQSATALSAEPGEMIVRVNVVEESGIGYLTVLWSSEDHLNPARGRVVIYEIVSD
jgi:hypothetical protein